MPLLELVDAHRHMGDHLPEGPAVDPVRLLGKALVRQPARQLSHDVLRLGRINVVDRIHLGFNVTFGRAAFIDAPQFDSFVREIRTGDRPTCSKMESSS